MSKISDDKQIDELSASELNEALLTPLQEPVNSLDESIEELKAMGIRDINDVNVSAAIGEAMKNIQIQKTLSDITRGSRDKRSPKDYLENHIKFLEKVTEGKDFKHILNSMTIEHAKYVLKITAKMDLPDEVIKKHLKTLKKKYN